PCPLHGCDLASIDKTKDGEPWGTENLPEFDWSIHLSSLDAAFNGSDSSDQCGHFLNLARRVFLWIRLWSCSECVVLTLCSQLLVLCVLWGFETCAYLKWVDKGWQGRPRQVIGKLVEENLALQKICEERQAMDMKHKKVIKTSDSRELCIVCLVCCSEVVYVVVALMIRGFV
ncbi:hypothetical protein ZWY2020_032063, partial [Hordeum vulgare]